MDCDKKTNAVELPPKLPVGGLEKSSGGDFLQKLTHFRSQVSPHTVYIRYVEFRTKCTAFQLRGEAAKTYFQRIVFIEPEPHDGDSNNKTFQVGRHFRTISAASPEHQPILKRSLQGYGMVDPSVRMVQSVYVISRLTSSNVFSSDDACKMNIDARRMYKKANILREVR